MTLNLSADDVLATTRAVRKRLDFERPVPRELVQECVDLAFQAPTGSNRQHWHFMIVDDPTKKRAIADLYGKAFDPYVGQSNNDFGIGDTRTERAGAIRDSATFLREEFHRNPLRMFAGLVAKPVLNAFRHRVDPRRYNGAALIGLRGVVVKSHGSADSFAYERAIERAVAEVANGVLKRIEDMMASPQANAA